MEIFMPADSADDVLLMIEHFMGVSCLSRIYFWCASQIDIDLPDNVVLIPVASLTSTRLFKDMAERASADFVLYVGKPWVLVYADKLAALCDAIPEDAAMAYAHYQKSIDGMVVNAPTIACLDGSLRNDFDFGPVRVFRTAALKQYLEMELDDYMYAGLYQLRLALGRIGGIFYFDDYLSLEREGDNRKSGEKQFDYVNPSQRAVQIEMELACTAHLKAVGAWLPPCRYSDIDLSAGEFSVEASVIIPVLNREKTIADAVRSVLEQVTSFDFNILVVDNHSTDRTGELIDSFNDQRVIHIVPERNDLGIGGCWNLAVNDVRCGRFAVQLDSDDLYSDNNTLQRIVDEFYKQRCAMLVGSYRICDFDLNTLPPGVIDHREWTEDNGRNNALRINGLGAPRAFYTPVIREVGFPNVSYGEDYAVGLQISRNYRIGRIYDVLYLCRRWGGNSDAALSHEKVNAHNLYKDSLRTAEFYARREMMRSLKIPTRSELGDLFARQLACWPETYERYSALGNVRKRVLGDGLILQYNPSRVISAAAKVDETSVRNRECFLCAANRPSCQSAESALGKIDVLVNPYPILPFHFTFPLKEHVQQRLEGMIPEMLLLAKEWNDMVIFYNGAKCGASAPDHAHLQAVCRDDVPLFTDEWKERIAEGLEPLLMTDGGGIFCSDAYVVPLLVVQAGSVSLASRLLLRLISAIPCVEEEDEPRMNVLCCHYPGEGLCVIVIPRSVHRPLNYCSAQEGGRMISPGALDMAGLVVAPREKDFVEMEKEEVVGILKEVAVCDERFSEIIENIIVCHEED